MAKTRTCEADQDRGVEAMRAERLRDHPRLPGALPLAGATFAIPSLHDRKLLPLTEPLVARPRPIVLVRFSRYAHTRRAPTWAQR